MHQNEKQVLHTESSTHTIVVKESLCEESSEYPEEDEEDYGNECFESTVVVVGKDTKTMVTEESERTTGYEEMLQKFEKDIR